MSSEIVQILVRRLKSDTPGSLLVVTPNLPDDLLEYSRSTDSPAFTHIAFDSLEASTQGLDRYEFAVVMHETFEGLSHHAAEQLVARLRDLHAKLLWVAVSDADNSVFSSKDAMAQGMRLVDSTRFGDKGIKWYEFSLRFYKPAPQWLNARDWANPDRWDKERW